MRILLQPELVEITEVRQETRDTFTMRFRFPSPSLAAAFGFQPGQFNMLTVFGVGEAPISLSSCPRQQEYFEHTIRTVGNVTRAISRLQPGGRLGLRGPYGRGWPMEEIKGHDILVVAGGIGLAPLRGAIGCILAEPENYGRLEILYGARSPEDQIFTYEYAGWRAHPRVALRLSVDRAPGIHPGAGEDAAARTGAAAAGTDPPDAGRRFDRVGPVTTLFPDVELEPANTAVLMCGPEVMMRFAVAQLLERGFRAEQIYVSLERRMECGLGKCGHCLIGPVYVCKDGPVFSYAEIRDLPEEVF
ncbi:MAG: FAD/NAD(P)-binding protein [Firmicutes bacterium]|nr:FAD/NAD(P)-binding protein [Bacillota bacterium]